MNTEKTEYTTIQRQTGRNATGTEPWRTVVKLGSLLGDSEDVENRKRKARMALSRVSQVMHRDNIVSRKTRMRIYNTVVFPALTYNMGTWGLTQTEIKSLEGFHRDQFRIQITCPIVLSTRKPNPDLSELIYY
jgi:hypothetical protein